MRAHVLGDKRLAGLCGTPGLVNRTDEDTIKRKVTA